MTKLPKITKFGNYTIKCGKYTIKFDKIGFTKFVNNKFLYDSDRFPFIVSIIKLSIALSLGFYIIRKYDNLSNERKLKQKKFENEYKQYCANNDSETKEIITNN